MKTVGKIIDGVSSINMNIDFSSLTNDEKVKLTSLLFNVKDYKFTSDEIEGKQAIFINVLKTREKFNVIDYVKNNI